jgi:hypothetical protein
LLPKMQKIGKKVLQKHYFLLQRENFFKIDE